VHSILSYTLSFFSKIDHEPIVVFHLRVRLFS
jgi:hypothetical protein